MVYYRVIFTDDLTEQAQFDFVPASIEGFVHDQVEAYEANYFIPDSYAETFSQHLVNHVQVEAWDLIALESQE